MKQDVYAKLEKNLKFKKGYLNATSWWKNFALIPPIILMFGGLAGMLYLFNFDKLISVYAIPYIVVFFLGTIWLKAIKTHLQKKMMDQPGAFHICLAAPFDEKDGLTYTVFANDTHRHNEHYIKNLAKNLTQENLSNEDRALSKKFSIKIDYNENSAYYLRAFKTSEIKKAGIGWADKDTFPVLYIDDKNTIIIKEKDLKRVK